MCFGVAVCACTGKRHPLCSRLQCTDHCPSLPGALHLPERTHTRDGPAPAPTVGAAQTGAWSRPPRACSTASLAHARPAAGLTGGDAAHIRHRLYVPAVHWRQACIRHWAARQEAPPAQRQGCTAWCALQRPGPASRVPQRRGERSTKEAEQPGCRSGWQLTLTAVPVPHVWELAGAGVGGAACDHAAVGLGVGHGGAGVR